MKIGFFDSGIGGLTVLQQAQLLLPEVEYIYYADTDHVPYGTKQKEEIIGYVDRAVGFLAGQGVKAIVIACNTATSVAIQFIRSKYKLPILGMEPAVKPAITKHPHQRVMIIATPLTLKEEKLRNLLNQVDEEHMIDLLPLPKLVTYAEAGRFTDNQVEEYLRKEFAPYQLENYSTLVLGCTHFNYFKDTLRKLLPDWMEFIDGNGGTVCHLKNVLKSNGLLEPGNPGLSFYRSGRIVTGEKELTYFKMLLKRAEEMSVL